MTKILMKGNEAIAEAAAFGGHEPPLIGKVRPDIETQRNGSDQYSTDSGGYRQG